MSRHARRTLSTPPLTARRRRARTRRALALGGMLAAVGGLVTARSTVAQAPTSALGSSALAAPPGAHAHPSRAHTPASHASGSSSGHASQNKAAKHARSRTQAPAPKQKPKPPAHRQITGQAYDVGYGIVQVRVSLVGQRIVDVTPLSLPQGGRSSDISSYAAPQLRQEALAAQSAHIDTVSGASYTSAGYARSLQSALDASRS